MADRRSPLPTPADPEFYLHRLDLCRCGKRRGDHEGPEPQPCPETGCQAFVLVKAHEPRARSLEIRARVLTIALEVIERLTGGNFGDDGSANEIADRVMDAIARCKAPMHHSEPPRDDPGAN